MPKWKSAGYKIAVWRDIPQDDNRYDRVVAGVYPGYAKAVNSLVALVLLEDSECNFVVAGGDDTEPDANVPPEEIALQCSNHFEALAPKNAWYPEAYATFGVMQPTGDRWGDTPGRAYADHVCGSPWMGRSFCERMYRGRGPLFDGYQHMHVDNELQEVSKRLGVLWQRPDLIHLHKHWGRKENATAADIPAHLQQWNTAKHWQESKNLFQNRLAAGFPGSEPLEAK